MLTCADSPSKSCRKHLKQLRYKWIDTYIPRHFFVKKNAKHMTSSTVIMGKLQLQHGNGVLTCKSSSIHQEVLLLDKSGHPSETVYL